MKTNLIFRQVLCRIFIKKKMNCKNMTSVLGKLINDIAESRKEMLYSNDLVQKWRPFLLVKITTDGKQFRIAHLATDFHSNSVQIFGKFLRRERMLSKIKVNNRIKIDTKNISKIFKTEIWSSQLKYFWKHHFILKQCFFGAKLNNYHEIKCKKHIIVHTRNENNEIFFNLEYFLLI